MNLTNAERAYLARLVREDAEKIMPVLKLEAELGSPHVEPLRAAVLRLRILANRIGNHK